MSRKKRLPCTDALLCTGGLIFSGKQTDTISFSSKPLCVCVCVVIPFILDVRHVDTPAGVTQEECHTGLLHLPSAVLALIFLARRIQSFLSLVDREVEFRIPTN